MKNQLILLFFAFFTTSINAQEANMFSFHAGLEVSADKVNSHKLIEKPIFWNYGIVGELQIKNCWFVHLNVSYSNRNYEEVHEETITFWERRYGGTASYSSQVDEQLIELENLAKYQFLNHRKWSPFVGLGYALQFSKVKMDERTIDHGDILREHLIDREVSNINPGIYAVIGLNVEIVESLNLIVDIGHKSYFNQTIGVSGYPFDEKISKRQNSTIISLGMLYKIK